MPLADRMLDITALLLMMVCLGGFITNGLDSFRHHKLVRVLRSIASVSFLYLAVYYMLSSAHILVAGVLSAWIIRMALIPLFLCLAAFPIVLWHEPK